MENLLLYLAQSFARGLRTPKFQRYLLGTTGCSTLLVAGNNTLHFKHTSEGDRVSFYEQETGGVTYGAIVVQMRDLYTLPEAERILVHYINKLRRPMGIACTFMLDIRKGAGSVSVSDYWQDQAGMDWKLKGETNGKTVAVLYVKNIGQSSVDDHDEFLDGFRFSSSVDDHDEFLDGFRFSRFQ